MQRSRIHTIDDLDSNLVANAFTIFFTHIFYIQYLICNVYVQSLLYILSVSPGCGMDHLKHSFIYHTWSAYKYTCMLNMVYLSYSFSTDIWSSSARDRHQASHTFVVITWDPAPSGIAWMSVAHDHNSIFINFDFPTNVQSIDASIHHVLITEPKDLGTIPVDVTHRHVLLKISYSF